MQRKFVISEGEYYHLYNRGVDKRTIFLDDKDRQRFMRLLYLANGENSFVFRDVQDKPFVDIDRGEPLVAIGAYVLMKNHFHILVKEIRKGGITSFMEKLQTGYSSYFNKRNSRAGSLFEGPYQAQHVSKDEYLKYLFSYIHLNPLKSIEPDWKEKGIKNKLRAKNFVKGYKYSSCPEYLGKDREEGSILTSREFPKYFAEPHDFEDFLHDWLSYKDKCEENT